MFINGEGVIEEQIWFMLIVYVCETCGILFLEIGKLYWNSIDYVQKRVHKVDLKHK